MGAFDTSNKAEHPGSKRLRWRVPQHDGVVNREVYPMVLAMEPLQEKHLHLMDCCLPRQTISWDAD